MTKERANTTVTLNILGKEFKVACPKEKESDLLHAARVLSDRMRGLRNPSGTASLDRMAIIAALNVTDELEQLKQELKAAETKAQDQFEELMKRVDSAMQEA